MKNVKKQKNLKPLLLPGILFLAFILFTLIVSTVDVKPIGPQNSCVGLASLNQAAANLFGVHLIWYTITDWLGVIAILFAFGFAVLGLCQLIHRKSLFKVDSGILLLGALYILTIALYAFFEIVIINYRPIILNQNLEASYPSSHTMIVTTIMITASFQFHRLLPNHKLLLRALDTFCIFLPLITILGRLISGVHWFTDILSGLLLSAALVSLYYALINLINQ